MKFALEVTCDNAAFDESDLYSELARIIRDAASRVEGCSLEGSLRDANGNKVGWFTITGGE